MSVLPPVVIFSSKYGSTAEYARAIAQVLGGIAVQASQVDEAGLKDTRIIVLGSPIYGPSVLPEMSGFLRGYDALLKGKPLAAFVVCGDTLWVPKAREGGHRNLAKLTDLLPNAPFAQAVFGGRMRMEDLDDEDGPRINAFYTRIGREPLGFDRMDLESAKIWARELRLSHVRSGLSSRPKK